MSTILVSQEAEEMQDDDVLLRELPPLNIEEL
jgi:hypothetical protein